MALESGVHRSAVIGENVTLGDGVSIGPGCVIHDNVQIGDDCAVGANVVLGEPLAASYDRRATYSNPPLVIGRGSVIRSGTVIYAGSEFGEGFATGHAAVIREGTKVGRHSRIGTQSDIQGACEIGDYVRIHSNVITSQGVRIHDFAWILPKCILSDCPHPPSEELHPVTVHRFAVLAAGVIVLPGMTIGEDSLVGAGAIVRRDVEAGAVVVGQPARQVAWARDLRSRTTGRPMYPWRDHFERGMPWEGIGYATWSRDSDRGQGDVS